MRKSILQAMGLGIAFCLGQSFLESILGYFIATFRQVNDINFEGVILYAIVRVLISLVPYIIIFVMAFQLKLKISPTILSFGLNLILISFFLYFGVFKKDPVSFVTSSVLIGFSLMLMDKKVNISSNASK